MKIKNDDLFLYAALGGVVLYALLRKPVTKAVWSLYAGPKFYAGITAAVQSNDPARIQRLHDKYDTWPEGVQSQFNESLRSMGLKRPW